MPNIILTKFTASISDLKKNPMEVALSGNGEPVVILNRNNPAFYCVPAQMFEKMFEIVEDYHLSKLAVEIDDDQDSIEVSTNDIQSHILSKIREKVGKD